MRAYAVLVAAFLLTATGCELEPSFECSRPGTDHCPCVELQCDTGLTCVNKTCFDLSSFGAVQPSAGSGAASAGNAAAIMSVMTGMPDSAGGNSAAVSGAAGIAGGSGAAGSSNGGAGVAAMTCAAVGSDCSFSSCCEGSVCISNSCSPICTSHRDCVSACCGVINPTVSACVHPMVCQGPSAGAGAGP